jgi:LPXTG-motif cell wall-anchored protein
MKKSLLTILIATVFTIFGMLPATAQEQPAPQKDSVNMDTQAKPTQYYDVEDDKPKAGGESKSSAGLVIGIVCAVVIIGSVVYFVGKKKRK